MNAVEPTQDDKTLAIITHISGILLGFIMPLVIWLTQKDTKPWLADQAKEALNFQITVAIAYLVCSLLIFAVIGIFLLPVIYVVDLVLCILAAVATSQGRDYRYPMTLRLIK